MLHALWRCAASSMLVLEMLAWWALFFGNCGGHGSNARRVWGVVCYAGVAVASITTGPRKEQLAGERRLHGECVMVCT